jgi:transposase InsO family protein
MELAAMKASVEHIRQKFAFTERRACRLLLVPISSYRYKPRQNDDGLRECLVELAREKPRFGYRRLHVLLERQGEVVNHKRVHRIYREAGLALRRKKRKHCVRVSTPLGVYTAANHVRSRASPSTLRGCPLEAAPTSSPAALVTSPSTTSILPPNMPAKLLTFPMCL